MALIIMENGFNIDDETKEIIKNGGFKDEIKNTTVDIYPNEEGLWTLKIVHLGYHFFERKDFENRQKAIENIGSCFDVIRCY